MKNFILFSLFSIAMFANVSMAINYREKMIQLIIDLSTFVKLKRPNFRVIPFGAPELIVKYGTTVHTDFKNAIDGVGADGLFYGNEKFGKITKSSKTRELKKYLGIAKTEQKICFITDYLTSSLLIDKNNQKISDYGCIPFHGETFELKEIPKKPTDVFNKNTNNILVLSDVKNYAFYLYSKKQAIFEAKILATEYDMIIINPIIENKYLSITDCEKLRIKKSGGRRLIFAYVDVGAIDTESDLLSEFDRVPYIYWSKNPEWENNYYVKFWYPKWQDILFGSASTSHMNKILENTCFDGVILDKVNSYKNFVAKKDG